MKVWKALLDDETFKKEIETDGFSKERRFVDYLKKHGLLSQIKKSGAITATNLSIDFFSKQSHELTDLGYYVIRTGRGRFMIFDSSRFPAPYVNLDISKAETLKFEVPLGFENLYDAFKSNMIENAALEQLRFLGVFKKIVKEITGESTYYVGPRGNKVSKFDVAFKDKDNNISKLFTYHGQEELDYSIFTKKAILFFEAKSLSSKKGLDVGWHKLAFPANRFKKYASSMKLIPCYFLKTGKVVHIFVFPEVKFSPEGIVLNDQKHFTPERVFKIDLTGY